MIPTNPRHVTTAACNLTLRHRGQHVIITCPTGAVEGVIQDVALPSVDKPFIVVDIDNSHYAFPDDAIVHFVNEHRGFPDPTDTGSLTRRIVSGLALTFAAAVVLLVIWGIAHGWATR